MPLIAHRTHLVTSAARFLSAVWIQLTVGCKENLQWKLKKPKKHTQN